MFAIVIKLNVCNVVCSSSLAYNTNQFIIHCFTLTETKRDVTCATIQRYTVSSSQRDPVVSIWNAVPSGAALKAYHTTYCETADDKNTKLANSILLLLAFSLIILRTYQNTLLNIHKTWCETKYVYSVHCLYQHTRSVRKVFHLVLELCIIYGGPLWMPLPGQEVLAGFHLTSVHCKNWAERIVQRKWIRL